MPTSPAYLSFNPHLSHQVHELISSDQQNRFTHFTHCWQVCLASQKTKNPIGRGADGKAPNCARWCENSCGCDPSMDPSATTGSAFPSDAASLSMTQRTRMSQSQGRGQPRTFTQEQNFPAV